jgi:hypothetical protein
MFTLRSLLVVPKSPHNNTVSTLSLFPTQHRDGAPPLAQVIFSETCISPSKPMHVSSPSFTSFPLLSMPPPLLRLPYRRIRHIRTKRRPKPPHHRVGHLPTIHACVVVALVVLVLLGEEPAFLVVLCHVGLKGGLGAGRVGGGHGSGRTGTPRKEGGCKIQGTECSVGEQKSARAH